MSSMRRIFIIGVALLLLTGCSALRLGYNNGQQLAWWWLDGYMDFSSEHAPQVKAALGQWFDWHRKTQLPEVATLLASAATQVVEPTTPAAICRWQQVLGEKLDPTIERALQHGADLLPGLGEPQFRHLEQRYAKSNAEMRTDFAQAVPAERLKASIERAIERSETVYGKLEEPQRRIITAGVTASPFDADAWLAEIERRQRETLQTLRRLAAEKSDRDERLAALRALAERFQNSSVPAYRSYRQRLTDYNCNLAAQVHNATTAAQRAIARDKLKGWEADVRSLIAQRPEGG
jgi:Family of unknown function (DUF6279)